MEVCVDEGGSLSVVQRYDLRALLTRLRPQGSELPPVGQGANCTSVYTGPDAAFNNFLRVLFLIVICLGVQNIILYHLVTGGFSQAGAMLLGFSAAVVFVSWFIKSTMKLSCSTLLWRERLKTFSSLVQDV